MSPGGSSRGELTRGLLVRWGCRRGGELAGGVFRGELSTRSCPSPIFDVSFFRLRGWRPLNSELGEWIKVDLGKLFIVEGVVMQGDEERYEWIYKFEIGKLSSFFLICTNRKIQ